MFATLATSTKIRPNPAQVWSATYGRNPGVGEEPGELLDIRLNYCWIYLLAFGLSATSWQGSKPDWA